jgi:hypothetical protein
MSAGQDIGMKAAGQDVVHELTGATKLSELIGERRASCFGAAKPAQLREENARPPDETRRPFLVRLWGHSVFTTSSSDPRSSNLANTAASDA